MTPEETLTAIANIAHHGGLMGFGDQFEALNEIRKLSLPYWDKEEGNHLQKLAYNQISKPSEFRRLVGDLREAEQAAKESKMVYGN